MKSIIFILTAFAASIFFSNASAQSVVADSIRTTVIKVGNLHCNNDMPTIKNRLLNQDGIDEVAFTDRASEQSSFTVTYHTSVTSEADIVKAIESTPGCDDPDEAPYRVVKERQRKMKSQ